MKKTEEAAISTAISVLTTLLEDDRDSSSPIAKLDPSARRAVDSARIGLEEIFDEHEAKINERFTRLAQLRLAAKNTNLQLAFFDEKGKPTSLDENGKIIPTQRVDKELERAIAESNDGIDPKDGVRQKIDFKLPGNGIPSGVPENIQKAIVQAVNDGAGQDKALDLVGKATKTPKLKMEKFWEMLVKRGIVFKENGKWVADESFAPPAPDSTDPDVLATSETPGQGLVSVTEPADAQAA